MPHHKSAVKRMRTTKRDRTKNLGSTTNFIFHRFTSCSKSFSETSKTS